MHGATLAHVVVDGHMGDVLDGDGARMAFGMGSNHVLKQSSSEAASGRLSRRCPPASCLSCLARTRSTAPLSVGAYPRLAWRL